MKEEEIIQLPITHPVSALKGLLAGSLIVGSVVYPFGVISIILFFAGLFVFLDTVIPAGTIMYGLTTLSFTVIGGLIVFVFRLVRDPGYYLTIIFVCTLIMYYPRIKKVVRH